MLNCTGWSGTDENIGGGDGGGRVEDVAIFVRSDKNDGQYQDSVHHWNSAGWTVWRENTRGKRREGRIEKGDLEKYQLTDDSAQ